MSELRKATLQEVAANESETPLGEPIPVQFNPTTLKLKLSNDVEGGRSRGRQRRQQTGNSSNVLSLDLIFDSADEGSEAQPVSVRTKTAIVEKYVVPEQNNPDPPPRLRFSWGGLILTGIVESVDITFEHFAANGTPLRAKVSLSIKEQNPTYQFLRGGPGSRPSSGAGSNGTGPSNPALPGAGTNSSGNPPSPNADERSAAALAGESPAEFAARQGLNPAAWRGLNADLSGGLGFAAGAQVGFKASLSAQLGVGVTAGVTASTNASLSASLGVSASAPTSSDVAVAAAIGVAAGLSTGFGAQASVGFSAGASVATKASDDGLQVGKALTAAGGVDVASETLRLSGSLSAADQTRASFHISNAPITRTGHNAAVRKVNRQPLNQSEGALLGDTGDQSGAAQAQVQYSYARHVTYGRGLPLRPLYATLGNREQYRLGRSNANQSYIQPPFSSDPSVPPWRALPAQSDSRTDLSIARKKRSGPCSSC